LGTTGTGSSVGGTGFGTTGTGGTSGTGSGR
jgi:hypothetical protein